MSRRIVITSWGSYGDIYPAIGLGKAVAARGHDVVLAVPAYYRPLVEREGLQIRPVGPDVDPSDRARIQRVLDSVRGTEAIIREWLMPALRGSYVELEAAAAGADLLVTHPVTFAAPILAEKLGLRWISTVLSPISFFSATDSPVIPAAPNMVHLRHLGAWYGRMVRALAHRATDAWMAPVRQLRAELGLARGRHPVFDGQFSPRLTLALFSRVLGAPQPDWPAHVVQTGFVFYNGPDPLPPDLSAFLDDGDPPIVFTLGSSGIGAAGRFYEESAEAAHRMGVRAVLLTGGVAENQPRRLDPHVLLVDHAPHALLFDRAAAIVHHGGVGTTGQALRAGRPMLVVPHSNDQPDNAYRVARLGVGRVLRPARYRAASVAAELQRLLSERPYRTKAAEIAARVAEDGGAVAAADAIEATLGL